MIWLVLSTVGYGSAWAFDSHIDEASEHNASISSEGDEPAGDRDHHACDHCCHASAHIVAFWCSNASVSLPTAGIGHTPYQLPVYFRSTAPLDRPPRV